MQQQQLLNAEESQTEQTSQTTQTPTVTEAAMPDALLQRLREAVTKRHRNFHLANGASLASLVVGPLWLFCLFAANSSKLATWREIATVGSIAGTFFYGALTYFLCVFAWRGKREVEEALKLLTESEDVRVVGPLLQALEMTEPSNDFALLSKGDWTAYRLAVPALKRLLPRLRATDAELLDAQQRTRLHRALRHSANRRDGRRYNPDFALTILAALQQVGNETDLPVVEAISRMSDRQTDARVREAALNCLPYLQEKRDEQHSRQTLLRAATLQSGPDILLRPALHAGSQPAEQLLRASNSQPSDTSR